MASRINLSTSDKIGFITNLAAMLGAGVPILEVVTTLLADTKGPQRIILETLRDDLTQGQPIHVSLAKFPRAFDKVTVNLVKAAEEAGTLETTLLDLRSHIQREMEFLDKIKFALIYPVFILVLFAVELMVILIVVIPKIATVFDRLRVPLPLPTQMLVYASNIVTHYTWYLVGGGVIAGGALLLLYASKKEVLQNVFYSLPLVSQIVQEIDITRFCRNMYLLLSSGLPIANALELCQDVVVKKSSARTIAISREQVLSGRSLSFGLHQGSTKFPPLVIKLIEAGEKSGTLDKSLQDLSEYLDYQVSNTLKAATAIMEPALLLTVGLTIGAMLIAIIAPIYGLISQVGVR